MIKLEEKKIQIIQLRIISIEYICNYFADANHYDTILLRCWGQKPPIVP